MTQVGATQYKNIKKIKPNLPGSKNKICTCNGQKHGRREIH